MKKMILLCALCLFGAGVVFGQAYSDLLYRDWAGLRAYAQVNKTLGDVRPTWFSWVTPSPRGGSTSTRSSFRKTTSWAAASRQTSSEMLVASART